MLVMGMLVPDSVDEDVTTEEASVRNNIAVTDVIPKESRINDEDRKLYLSELTIFKIPFDHLFERK